MIKEVENTDLQKNIPDIFNVLRAIAILCVFGIHTLITLKDLHLNIKFPIFFNTPAWGAMWMFFILSGYLLGKGFYSGKYNVNWQGIRIFWLNRIIRILPMYLFFIFIAFLFVNPQWFIEQNYKILLPLFTFTYNGSPGIVGVGATWFISTIVQLYILAPIFYKFIFSKINKHQQWYLLLIIALGLGIRLLENVFKLDYWPWSVTFSLLNLDLFFGGMLLNSITQNSPDNKFKKIMRPVSIIILLAVISFFTYQISLEQWWLYEYIAPTIYLLTMSLIIYSFDYKGKPLIAPLNIKNVIKNPIRLLECLGVISFSFYLYHSNLLVIVSSLIPHNHPRLLMYGTLLGTFVIASIFSTCIYFMIEKPSNKLRYSINKNQ